MSHDTHNPFSNETGEYLQEVQENKPVEREQVKTPKPAEESKPVKRPYRKAGA